MNDMLIEKSRSGVYQDTPENRRLHRVGQRYGKVAQKEEDFESFADRYEKEYRKKHSGSPVKNSEIRYEASKAWDKMHSSENSRLHHVGQKYGGVKKDEAKVDYKDVKSVADFLLDKFNIYSKIENYSEVSPTYLKLNKGVEIRFSPKKESERVGKVFYTSSQFDNEPVYVTILASFDKYPELKKLFDKLSSTNLKEATDGKTDQWGTWKFAIRSKEDLKKFGEIYNQVFNKKKAVSESGVKKDETKQEGTLPKVNFSEKDFRREVDEEMMEEYPNAKVKLHHYLAPRTDYYDNDGNLMRSTPFITEFYSDYSQSSIGGYEIYFDRADSIGTFRTKESAIAALNKYVNAMRVKGHSKPEWAHNQSNGSYQWNYTVPKPPEKQVEEVPSKVEKQPVKKNGEKQDKPTSRVTFADVPRSREVNLKKYLTDSRRKDVDRLMQAADGMPLSVIKQAHDAAVKKFNDNFDSMKKSERASALYVIMKYKDLLNKAK